MDKKLDQMRSRIDELDAVILDKLAERMKVVDDIGAYKRENELDARDEKRRNEVASDRMSRGKSRGLSGELVRKIFDAILDYAEERERK